MAKKISLDERNSGKQLEDFFNKIKKKVLEKCEEIIVEEAKTTYEKFKPSLEFATLIGEDPGKPLEFINKKCPTKLDGSIIKSKQSINFNFNIDVSEINKMTIQAQNHGTGADINAKIVENFGVQPAVNSNGMSKWYLTPKYHLDNFKIEFESIPKKLEKRIKKEVKL